MSAHLARRIVVVSLVLGLLAVRLCFDLPIGINAPILTVLIFIGAWFTRPSGARFDPLDAWLPAGAVALTVGAALRGDPVLQIVDLGLALALVGAAVPAIAGFAITRSTALALAGIGVRVVTSVAIAGAPILVAASPTPDRASLASGRRAVAPVARGLGIAIPIVILFVALFANADAVFARLAQGALHPDLRLGDLPARGSLALVIAWLAAGLFAMWASILPTVEAGPIEGWPAPAGWTPPSDRPIGAGTTEAFVVLGAVDAIFALFVGLQVAYLFGGHDTLAVAGMTYSDYARRGFFELVIVAVLAVGLVVVVDRVVGRRSRAVVGASVVLLAFTAVVLVSALVRLRLYQDAYGWTELRFYVLTTIAVPRLRPASRPRCSSARPDRLARPRARDRRRGRRRVPGGHRAGRVHRGSEPRAGTPPGARAGRRPHRARRRVPRGPRRRRDPGPRGHVRPAVDGGQPTRRRCPRPPLGGPPQRSRPTATPAAWNLGRARATTRCSSCSAR